MGDAKDNLKMNCLLEIEERYEATFKHKTIPNDMSFLILEITNQHVYLMTHIIELMKRVRELEEKSNK